MSTPGNLGFWLYNSTNGLRGAASTFEHLPDGRVVLMKDPNNPAVLEDEFIVYALQHSPQARNDFNRLFPSLDAESQERLTNLVQRNPRATMLLVDSQVYEDNIQKKQVTAGVHLGKKGRPSQIAAKDRVETT